MTSKERVYILTEMQKRYAENYTARKSLSTLCVTFNNGIMNALKHRVITTEDADLFEKFNMDLWKSFRAFREEQKVLKDEYREMS